MERTLIPAHYNYQVRLKEFFSRCGIQAEWEKDFVDVRFNVDGHEFIGEIKVTTTLPVTTAFRTALGQLIEYAHLLFSKPPQMVMFLDQRLDRDRVTIATKLGICVVVETTPKIYEVLNPEVSPTLGVRMSERVVF